MNARSSRCCYNTRRTTFYLVARKLLPSILISKRARTLPLNRRWHNNVLRTSANLLEIRKKSAKFCLFLLAGKSLSFLVRSLLRVAVASSSSAFRPSEYISIVVDISRDGWNGPNAATAAIAASLRPKPSNTFVAQRKSDRVEGNCFRFESFAPCRIMLAWYESRHTDFSGSFTSASHDSATCECDQSDKVLTNRETIINSLSAQKLTVWWCLSFHVLLVEWTDLSVFSSHQSQFTTDYLNRAVRTRSVCDPLLARPDDIRAQWNRMRNFCMPNEERQLNLLNSVFSVRSTFRICPLFRTFLPHLCQSMAHSLVVPVCIVRTDFVSRIVVNVARHSMHVRHLKHSHSRALAAFECLRDLASLLHLVLRLTFFCRFSQRMRSHKWTVNTHATARSTKILKITRENS